MTTDRDQSIERLLRHSRAVEPHGDDACPDAETLAALADDALTAAARREIEGHVADCHRCQALTAAMVRAEASTRATDGVAAVPWWKGGAIRWLVPAAAAATAVALWVAIPAQRTPLPAEEPIAESQIAAEPPVAAREASERDAPQTPEAPRTDRPSQGRVAEGALERAVPATPPAAAPAEAPVPSSPNASAPPAASTDRLADMPQPSQEGVGQRSREEADNRTAAGNDTAVAERERRLSAPAPPARSERAAVLGALIASGIDVVSPDPQRRWRIGPGTGVQRSVDGGATWTRQETGARTELTAGGAPTPDVCWVVGRGGVVLRTIDGGRQWQRLAFPQTVDLTAVNASSTLIAILDAADGRRFRTTDGGLTWVPAR